MKLIKIFGGLVLVLLVLFFLMRNTDLVTVDLVFKVYPDIQVAVVMLGAISVGMIIGYAVAVTNILSSKTTPCSVVISETAAGCAPIQYSA